MRALVRAVVLPVLAALASVALPQEALAIPAFARKYRVSCNMCHAPVPRLNAFGEQFAGNGFRMIRGESPADTIDTGDSALRLLRELPLAVRLDAYAAVNGEGDGASTDLRMPWMIKLLSGGQLASDVSYYMYFFLGERGEVAGLEDAYLQFNDVLSSGVDLIAGQFQVSDPLFKRELRLEYEDYQAYRVRVGDARADLTYERGFMASRPLWGGADVVVQLVNGRGLDEAGSDRAFDSDKGKNVAVRLSQDLGVARVGGIFYGGDETAEGRNSPLRVWGADATVPVGSRLEANLQYLRRRDGNPFFLATCAVGDPRCAAGAPDPTRTDVDAWMAEGVLSPAGPLGRWHFTALYNRVTSDRRVFTVRAGEDDYLDRYETAAVAAHFVRARNLRFMGEILRDIEGGSTRIVVGLTTAF